MTKLRQIHRKGRGSNNGGRGGSGGGGVLCTCDTSVIKIADVTQKLDSATAAATTKGNNNRDGGKEEIVCISGDAQVWLPDLQLVYECREKGE